MTYKEDEMQGEPREIMRPLSVGTTLCHLSDKKTVCQVKCHAPERLEPIASAT
jgi:hypothetical protein